MTNTDWIRVKIASLAAELLRMAGDEFGNHTCNDFDLPAAWTTRDKREFLDGWQIWNGSADEEPEEDIPDFAAMGYVAYLLERGPDTSWIRVEDRLPERDGDYLVYAPSMPTIIKVVSVIKPKEYGFMDIITHWQPLPDPPQDLDKVSPEAKFRPEMPE